MNKIIWIVFLIAIGFGIVWVVDGYQSQSEEVSGGNLIGSKISSTGFDRADGSHKWNFPIDFGPHPEYQTEWWYYTGNLQTTDGRRFGYQLTFFRRGLIPVENSEERDSRWGTDQVYMAHFALSDIAGKAYNDSERFSRGAAGLAGAEADPFRVWLENWEILQTENGYYTLKAEQNGVQLDLVLIDDKGVILHGIDGYSKKGADSGNASYYFSQTRLTSEGMIRIDNENYPVNGLSWMDHEFSTSALSEGQVGWDWFSFQLDDGTDLMMYQFRQSDGSIDPYSNGTVISPEGKTIHLDNNDFDIQVKANWQSPRSNATYPSAWTIQIPKMDLILEVKPYLADQELNVSYMYWEGAVGIKGVYSGQEVTGSGYVELTGYAASMEGEF